MARTRIDEVSHPELTYSAQPLKQRGIQKHGFPGQEFHDIPDGIVERLRITGVWPTRL